MSESPTRKLVKIISYMYPNSPTFPSKTKATSFSRVTPRNFCIPAAQGRNEIEVGAPKHRDVSFRGMAFPSLWALFSFVRFLLTFGPPTINVVPALVLLQWKKKSKSLEGELKFVLLLSFIFLFFRCMLYFDAVAVWKNTFCHSTT